MTVTMQTPGLLTLIYAKAQTPRPDCMIWPGAVDRGYGRVFVDGRSQRVHRVVWQLEHGPIPDGLTIDHLCRIRSCVNTEHMELVTADENLRRAAAARPPSHRPPPTYRAGPKATHCRKGHEYPTDAPAYGTSKNRCPECQRKRRRRNSPGG